MIQEEDETAIDFMRRVVGWLNYEQEDLLSDLPSVEAVFEFAALYTTYGTDFLQGIFECIEEGDDPAPYENFVKKYNLDWRVPKVTRWVIEDWHGNYPFGDKTFDTFQDAWDFIHTNSPEEDWQDLSVEIAGR